MICGRLAILFGKRLSVTGSESDEEDFEKMMENSWESSVQSGTVPFSSCR